MRTAWLSCLFLAAAAVAAPAAAQCPASPPEQGASLWDTQVFPADNWWRQDISAFPVDPNSAAFINFIGPTKGMHPDFGGEAGGDDIYGFPYAVVNGDEEVKQPVTFEVWDESDGVDMATGEGVPFYPIPVEAIDQAHWIEGGPAGTVDIRGDSDRHLLIVDCVNHHLYELYNVWYDQSTSQWFAYSGAFFDLNSNERRPEGWTSADAAGLAILPGLARYDEAGDPDFDDLGHALRMTVRATNGHVYPASHTAGSTAGALPMGARLRLKKLVNGQDPVLRTSDPIARRLLRAMQKYGLIVADNGSDMYVSGTFDTRWDNDILNPAFSAIKASDFEVIQLGYDPAAVGQLSINDVSTTEGNSGTRNLTFTVSLSMPHAAPVTFDLATGGGSATPGVDYVAVNLTGQSIPAGQTSKTFNVVINGDTTIESGEDFVLQIRNASAPIADANGSGTIVNDDLPLMSIADASVAEGNAGTKLLNFTVSLSQAAPYPVFVNASTNGSGNATAGTDYTALNYVPIDIPAGALSAQVGVTINGDTTIEPTEYLVVALANAIGATVVDGAALGTIANDDQPTISILDRTITEGNTGTSVAAFTVALSQAGLAPVTVDLSTGTTGNATSGVDYVAADVNGVVFQPGQTTKAFNVTVNGDTTIEPNEFFVARIDAVTGATLVDGTALGTITNNDFPALSINDVAVAEGNSGTKSAVFTVSLSQAAPFAVSYNIQTNGTGTATAGPDYASLASGSIIPAGQLAKTQAVTIVGDTTIEADETFGIALLGPVNATLADGSGLGTITNDDKPLLTIADASITEGASGTKLLAFTVTLSQTAPYPVVLDLATTGSGTATAGVDYVARSLTGLQIAAGTLSRTINVTINGDTTVEPNEVFVVAVSNVTGANVADGHALGTITNDD
jgi:hypothetical protein